MAKGSTAVFPSREFRDPDTGSRVTRITPPGTNCLRNYFYQKTFSSGGDFLILGSDQAGTMNFWLLDRTGKARQLTEGLNENIQGAYLSPDDRSLYFTRSGRYHMRVDLETLKEDLVYEVPPGWLGYGTWSPNSACTHAAGMLMKEEDRVSHGTGWERFTRQFEANPLQRLIDIDLTTGRDRVVYEVRQHLGHPMFRPHDDELMGFCQEGPHDLVESRIWFIDRDGTRLRKVKDHAPGESVMHEFWVPDGSRLLYVSYVKGEADRSIWAVDPATLVNTRLMSMPPCAHLMSNAAGTSLVGDGAGQLGDVSDKEGHAFSPDPFLHLFDLATRSHRRICGHHSSWAVWKGNTQATHPHPSFTPDETQVLFASDFEGGLGLYLADLG